MTSTSLYHATGGPMHATTTSPANPDRTYTVRRSTVVSRTFLGGGPDTTGLFEITVLRSWRQKGATYQGTVCLKDGSWVAQLPNNGAIVGTFADYVDAESALVKVRTGQKSYQLWDGPRPAEPVKAPLCIVCSHALLRDGDCTRPELHWHLGTLDEHSTSVHTPEQIAKSEMRVRFHESRNRCNARTYWADRESVKV